MGKRFLLVPGLLMLAACAHSPNGNKPDGCVTLYYKIGDDGKATAIEVHDSQPAGLYDSLAIASAKAASFPSGAVAKQQAHPDAHYLMTINFEGTHGPRPICKQ